MRIFTQRGVAPEMVEHAQDWTSLSREIEGDSAGVLVRDARTAGWDGQPAALRVSWWVETGTVWPERPLREYAAWDPTGPQASDAVSYLVRVEMDIPTK